MARTSEKLFAGLQSVLPQHGLSALVHWFMRRETKWLKNMQIRTVARIVDIDWEEAASANPDDYRHFNDFFTRELKPGARPLDPDPAALLCPADGRVSAAGKINGDDVFQAKGREYSLRALLADDRCCPELVGGNFWNVYLSPRDYHRVHMPAAGELQRMTYVPGRLFSVSPGTVRQVPGLFARNERVVCLFETDHGPMAVVLVGAMLVSSMDTVWAGPVTPNDLQRPETRHYGPGDVRLDRGAELGRFNMGSTVIVVVPPGTAAMESGLESETPVRMGRRIGSWLDGNTP